MKKFDVNNVRDLVHEFPSSKGEMLTLSEVEAIVGKIHNYILTYKELITEHPGIKPSGVDKSMLFSYILPYIERKNLGKPSNQEGSYYIPNGRVGRAGRGRSGLIDSIDRANAEALGETTARAEPVTDWEAMHLRERATVRETNQGQPQGVPAHVGTAGNIPIMEEPIVQPEQEQSFSNAQAATFIR